MKLFNLATLNIVKYCFHGRAKYNFKMVLMFEWLSF